MGQRGARRAVVSRFAVVLASGALAVACSPQSAAEATPTAQSQAQPTHPVSGLPVIPLTVTTGGKVHTFRVELAETPEAQQRGLMFRTTLGPDEGMIFPSVPQDVRSFWMKNTPLPLDIVFVGVDGRVLNIAANTTPYSLDPVESVGVTSGVLELAGGRAAELGIVAGDKVKW